MISRVECLEARSAGAPSASGGSNSRTCGCAKLVGHGGGGPTARGGGGLASRWEPLEKEKSVTPCSVSGLGGHGNGGSRDRGEGATEKKIHVSRGQ